MDADNELVTHYQGTWTLNFNNQLLTFLSKLKLSKKIEDCLKTQRMQRIR